MSTAYQILKVASSGVFSAGEAAAFLELPYARQAIQLRKWDDYAKVAGLVAPDLAHFTKYIEACI